MLTGIPCCHAVASCIFAKQDPENLIPDCYRVEKYEACYRPIIYPTNGNNLWVSTPYPNILPPPLRKLPGRPKRKRNKDGDEKARDSSLVSRKGMPARCSKCKQPGHNKASCRGPSTPTATNQTQNAPNQSQNVQHAPAVPAGQNATQTQQSPAVPASHNATQTQTVATSQKKPRGRPRKFNVAASTQPVTSSVSATSDMVTNISGANSQPAASSRDSTTTHFARQKLKIWRP